jgi:hypothetical protein
MYNGYSFQEIIALLLATPVLLMVLVAVFNSDGLNNLILKTSGSNRLDSSISNKEAWQAGFKVFYTLLCLSVLTILFLYTHDSMVEGQWFKNFFRWIFIIILVGGGISIFYRVITYLSK